MIVSTSIFIQPEVDNSINTYSAAGHQTPVIFDAGGSGGRGNINNKQAQLYLTLFIQFAARE